MVDDDIVMVPVKKRHLSVVYAAMTDADREADGSAARAADDRDRAPEEANGHTRQSVGKLKSAITNVAVRAVLDHLADNSGRRYGFSELVAVTGRTHVGLRGDLGGFTKVCKRVTGLGWPLEWSEQDGELGYWMSAEVAEWWREA